MGVCVTTMSISVLGEDDDTRLLEQNVGVEVSSPDENFVGIEDKFIGEELSGPDNVQNAEEGVSPGRLTRGPRRGTIFLSWKNPHHH